MSDSATHFYENALMLLQYIFTQTYWGKLSYTSIFVRCFILIDTCLSLLWDGACITFHLVAIIRESITSNPNNMVCIFNRFIFDFSYYHQRLVILIENYLSLSKVVVIIKGVSPLINLQKKVPHSPTFWWRQCISQGCGKRKKQQLFE